MQESEGQGRPGQGGRDFTPSETRLVKLGCGGLVALFVGVLVLAIVVLSRGCDESTEVLRGFRDDIKAGRVGPMPKAQEDDAEMRAAVAASLGVSTSDFESVEKGDEHWVCARGDLAMAAGTRQVNLLARRAAGGKWEFHGASLENRCKISRGGPRFLKP